MHAPVFQALGTLPVGESLLLGFLGDAGNVIEFYHVDEAELRRREIVTDYL